MIDEMVRGGCLGNPNIVAGQFRGFASRPAATLGLMVDAHAGGYPRRRAQ